MLSTWGAAASGTRASCGCVFGCGLVTSLSTASWLVISLRAASSRAPRMCSLATPTSASSSVVATLATASRPPATSRARNAAMRAASSSSTPPSPSPSAARSALDDKSRGRRTAGATNALFLPLGGALLLINPTGWHGKRFIHANTALAAGVKTFIYRRPGDVTGREGWWRNEFADATLHAAVGDVDAGEFVVQLLMPALDSLLGNGGNGGSDQKN